MKAAMADYLSSIAEKRRLSESLSDPNTRKRLKEILDAEYKDVTVEIGEEADIVATLETLEHSKAIQRAHILEQALDFAATKYEYAHKLLEQLHSTLHNQMLIVMTPGDLAQQAERFQGQLEVEQVLVDKLQDVPGFHDMFRSLATGEHMIHRMQGKEKKLYGKMKAIMSSVFADERDRGNIFALSNLVYNGLEDAVHEWVAKTDQPSHHAFIDHVFINTPQFVDFVREKAALIYKRNVSEDRISTFVRVFREWYEEVKS